MKLEDVIPGINLSGDKIGDIKVKNYFDKRICT